MPGGITPKARFVVLVAAVVALAVAATVLGARAGSGGSSEPDAPNVVVVMTDDQAVDTMSAMPRTKRLVGSKGVDFRSSIVSYPLCCPSRATFQTGQYAHNHGVLENHPPKGGYGAFKARSALPVWLSEAGYETGFVGKYLNGYGKKGKEDEIPPGWAEWYGIPAASKQIPFDFELNENGKLVSYDDGEYKTEVLEEKADALVRDWSRAERPFFLWVATDAPHKDRHTDEDAERDPAPAPRDLGEFEDATAPRGAAFNEEDVSDKHGLVKGKDPLDDADLARVDLTYRSELESLIAVDRLVASIVKELRRAGELDDTVIMFTSDNGLLRGQHRIVSGKASLFEEAIQVPLLVRGPGFPQGERDHRVVGNIDLAPTILELSGASPDIEPDGISLLPYEERRREWRPRLLLEVFERQKGNFAGIRTPRFTYVEYDKINMKGENKRELYDLEKDPAQLENVAYDPAYAREVERLDRLVGELRDCAGPTCR